jgi:hypothetical protein
MRGYSIFKDDSTVYVTAFNQDYVQQLLDHEKQLHDRYPGLNVEIRNQEMGELTYLIRKL